MKFDSIYGYIKINWDYHRSVDFIKSLGKDDSYPFINTNMSSFGDYEIPYYYENIMFGFAATYKYFGVKVADWNSFILKIEHILRNIDFENAQFHVDCTIGHYTLYWTKDGPSHTGEEKERKFLEENFLTKTDEWYFGFGKRGTLSAYIEKVEYYEDLRNESIPDFNFIYPVPYKLSDL